MRLAGGGEPTLHPDFPDLLSFLAEHGIILDNLTTNGTLLTDRVLAMLMKLRVSEIRVSLNYPTAETYAAGMGLPERFFGRVTEAIRRLDQARRAHPDFGRLMIRYVPQDSLVELKSLKYYLTSFRNVGILQEHAVNRILKDLVALLKPVSMTVEAEYRERGGIRGRATARYQNEHRDKDEARK